MAEKNYKVTAWSRPGQKDMLLYSNQQAIYYSKPPCESNFLQVGNDEWMYACRVLSPSSFKLYIYFCSNMDGYLEAMSSLKACRDLGITDRTFRSARNELEEKGYLHLKEKDGIKLFYDCWCFYTHPSHNPDYDWDESLAVL